MQAIYERAHGLDHWTVVKDLHDLAEMYCCQGRYDQAEQLYKQA